MAETLSLMEFLQALLTDAELRSGFGHDPQGTLADHGLADLSPADVHDALVLVQDNQTVDFSLDPAGTPAPPPPPPAGDGHEAAVEYLARYLADPQQPAPAEPWADVDPDAAEAPASGTPHDAAPGAFGAGDDGGYGAGAPPADRWDLDPDDLGLAGFDAAPAPAGLGGGDLGGYDLGEYDGVDGSGADGSDLGNDPGDDPGNDPGVHGEDPGPGGV